MLNPIDWLCMSHLKELQSLVFHHHDLGITVAHTGEGNGTHSSPLPGESQGQGSLVGYIPWGHIESDTTGLTEPTRTWLMHHVL